jgi:AraC-like DNA-binding protein
VLSRLSELLFMEVLRWQLTYISDGHSGWLAGLKDVHVGRALTLLHGDPARAWTVEDLAVSAGISRAALAKKFPELVGEAPMQYLVGWRMHLARRMLRESNIGVAELAARVGYESEAAFSRAFRRAVGMPPATWRDANAAEPISESQPSTDPALSHGRGCAVSFATFGAKCRRSLGQASISGSIRGQRGQTGRVGAQTAANTGRWSGANTCC